MRNLALAVLFLLGLLGPSWAKGPYDSFRVGNWDAGAYTDDKSGAFSHCAASVDYINDGGTLFIWVHKDYSWSMGVYRNAIQNRVGSNLSITVSFDNVGPYTLNAWVRQKHFFIADLPGNDVAVEAFKGAEYVHIRSSAGYFRYSLVSTRELMPALISCVRSHTNSDTTTSDNTPNPSATPSPQPSKNSEADAAREKLLKEVGAEFNNCVTTNMKEIVPYSNEGAETIAQVILTKCADIQKRFVDLTVAIYGASRDNAEKIMADTIAERKRSIVADIVTFRAELTKTLMNKPKKSEPENTARPSDQGL